MPTKKKTPSKPAHDELHEMQIRLQPELRPHYTNLAFVSHTRREFSMDFCFQVHGTTNLVSRLVTSPGHAKALLHVLKEKVNKYEMEYGEIEPNPRGNKKRRTKEPGRKKTPKRTGRNTR